MECGKENLRSLHRIVRCMLAQRACPELGVSDVMVEHILTQLALLDTNNFEDHIGGGEREGRVVAPLVRRRTFGLSHGVGRSGNLTEDQPKAAGSSLLYHLTNLLTLDLLKLSGARSFTGALCVPMATGMTITVVLQTVTNIRRKEIAEKHPGLPAPRYVIWPRVDQKTALKCIHVAGLEAVVVPLQKAALCGSHRGKHPLFLQVSPEDIAHAVETVGPDQVVCILSTTSCFAPRIPDDVLPIARYAKQNGVPYVINNAYGTQSSVIMKRIEAAQREYRVDYVVQSSDKNFLTPVGGAIVCSTSAESVRHVGDMYAGRASAAPILDLFITALHLGRQGMRQLWEQRTAVFQQLVTRLEMFAIARGEALVQESMRESEEEMSVTCGPCGAEQQWRNDISVAITLHRYGVEREVSLPSINEDGVYSLSLSSDSLSATCIVQRDAACKSLGGKLFRSRVTGPRVVIPSENTVCIAGKHRFQSYGCHQDRPVCPFLVIACGIGMRSDEVDSLLAVLQKVWPAH